MILLSIPLFSIYLVLTLSNAFAQNSPLHPPTNPTRNNQVSPDQKTPDQYNFQGNFFFIQIPEEKKSSVHNFPLTIKKRAIRIGTNKKTVEKYKVLLKTNSPGRLHIEAEKDRFLFPLPDNVRTFPTLDSLESFLRSSLSAKTEIKNKKILNFKVETTQVGSAYWPNPRNKLLYKVNDPILAFLGGSSGKIRVAGQTICIDPDKSCDNGIASYLHPIVIPTLPTHINECSLSGDACVQYHSFFNKVDLGFFKYAGHGANSKVTRGRGAAFERATICDDADVEVIDDPFIEQLQVTIRTGGDDLRGGNDNAIAVIGLNNTATGTLEPDPILNRRGRWADNSVHTVIIEGFPENTRLSNLTSFTIKTSFSGGIAGDNWNMDSIIVRAVTSSGLQTIINRSGTPLVRFTGDDKERTWGLRLGTEGLQVCFHTFSDVFLAVESSNLLKRVNDPSVGLIGWDSFSLNPVSARGADSVETAYRGASIGISNNNDLGLGAAPSFTEIESDGICSRHRSTLGDGSTGNGNYPGAEDFRYCP